MASNQLQERLFQRIREKLPADASLADAIADKLYLSADSAYRRIRGETLLVLDEAATLCNEFSLSLDDLLKEQASSISFTPFRVDQANSFESYMKGLLDNLKRVAAGKQKEIIYLSKDMPVFYDLMFPALADFHYFCWLKSIVEHPEFTDAKFRLGMMPEGVRQLAKEFTSVYTTINSVEIWNSECANSTIAQVQFYREAGYFNSDADADEVLRSLAETLEHIQLQAEYGCKFQPGEKPQFKEQNYQLFVNRLVLADNTIAVCLDGKRLVYLNYEVLNYMFTTDEAFCDETFTRMHNLMRRSTLISQSNEKQRSKFFNLLLKKIPV